MINKIIVNLLLCLLFFAFSSQGWAARIAILEPKDMSLSRTSHTSQAIEGKDTVRKLLEDVLSQGNNEVLDRADVDRILTSKSMQAVGEISRQKSYVLGKILDADILVTGNFIQQDDSMVINTSFIDTGRTALAGIRGKILDIFLSEYELRCQVKAAKGRNAVINVGSLSGLADGNMLDVFHKGKKVGLLRIAKASPQECSVVLVKGKTVRTRDEVRKMPVVWGKGNREMIITSTPPSAQITINDKGIGCTPLLFKNNEDELTIRIDSPDHYHYEEMLQFVNPDYSFLNLSLMIISLQEKPKEIPVSGSLFVTSEPSSAYVYLNGILKGVTPLLVTDIAPQKYWLKVAKPGFATKSRRIIIESSQQTKVNLSLRETVVPRKEPLPSLELLSIQTNNMVSPGECFLAARYPEGFILKLGLPVEGMEIRIAGLGIGLKHRLTRDMSLDMYYNFYDARKKEQESQHGISLVSGYPLKSRFFEGQSCLGAGYYSEKGYRGFGGIEIPIIVGVYSLMLEADTIDGYAVGFKEIFRNGAEAVFGIGKDVKGETRYDVTISYRSGGKK
ncbi:MAG: PEGA domain-containing protein [bacterium]|nr:PEGA domain-containing protein [bacterium]